MYFPIMGTMGIAMELYTKRYNDRTWQIDPLEMIHFLGSSPASFSGRSRVLPVPRQAPSRRDFLASAWDPQEPRKWALRPVPNAPWDGKPDFAGTAYCRTSIYPAIAYSPMSMGPMSMFPLNVVFFFSYCIPIVGKESIGASGIVSKRGL